MDDHPPLSTSDLRRLLHILPADPAAAESLQLTLRRRVEPGPASPVAPRTVAGLDVSYAVGTDRLVAATVVIEMATLAVVDQATAAGEAPFPYVPGLLGFREVPFLLAALEGLRVTPEALACDGYGVAHPRRFGLACHLGVATGLPAFGVAKTPFTTAFSPPGGQRGAWSELRDGDEVLGRVLRTRPGVKPVFVSVGHRIGLAEACALTLALTPRYRLPETTRLADHLSRTELNRRIRG
jgi:deoxyribonuclease V